MKRKLIGTLLAIMLVASLFALIACDNEQPTPTYSVTITDSAHGKVTADATTVTAEGSVTFTITPDQGYVLDELKVNGTKVDVSGNTYAVANVSADITVSATFKAITMTVSFNVAPTQSKQVTYGATYGELPTPIGQTGQRFVGWYTQENGEGTKVEDTTVVTATEDHTLYALFTDKYVVTFNYGLGSGREETRLVAYNTAIGELPTVQAPVASMLYGWFVGETKIDQNYLVTDDITVKASYITAELSLKQGSATTAIDGLSEASANIYPEVVVVVKIDGEVKDVAVTLETTDSAIATVVDGKVKAVADGEVQIVVKYNGEEIARLDDMIVCRSYADYTTVADKAGFLAIKDNKAGKYYLTADIDLENAAMWDVNNGYKPIFDVFTGVIDGRGHKVSNAVAHPSGWFQGMFTEMQGVVRDIAFVNFYTETSKAAGNGLFGNVKGLVENVYLDYNVRYTGVQENHAVAPLASYVENGGILKNIVVNMRTASNQYIDAAAVAFSAQSWGGKVENVFVMTNGKSLSATISGGLYYKEAAEGVGDGITKNSGTYLYTYSLINSETTDITKLDSSVWSVREGAVYFYETLALAATPEYDIVYTGGNIVKEYETELPTAEILNIVFLHNTAKMDEVPTNVTFASTNEGVATVGVDEDGNVFIAYNGAGTTTITVKIGEVQVSFDITLNQIVHIASAEDLRTKMPNSLNSVIVLDNDIDLQMNTVKGNGDWSSFGTFTGTLDGQGHKIANFYVGNGWQGGFFFSMKGTIRNIAFVNVNSPSATANTANGLFATLDGGAVLENVYIDYVFNANGSAIGTDTNYVAAGPVCGPIFAATVNNVIVNIRFGKDFDFANIDKIGAITGKACAWAAKVSNVKVIVNADVTLKLSYADAVGEDGVQNTWTNCATYADYAALKASDLSAFNASVWSFADDGLTFGENKVL